MAIEKGSNHPYTIRTPDREKEYAFAKRLEKLVVNGEKERKGSMEHDVLRMMEQYGANRLRADKGLEDGLLEIQHEQDR
ncbi:hypothetical protein BCON_0115g00220 [Botryotinia convoluta]|uniref:Uncharacterized protein n=1 Tax=Botryotinia convoluta TaxID=54673 RepID=A0A4Z1HXI8_9HELO|nr:hypothetical protein BCON_0115g00220 [Botryotinia convoluta]